MIEDYDRRALRRFASFCELNPVTGCVEWKGARSKSQNGYGSYGAFHYKKKTHYAHRWKLEFIDGKDVSGMEVHHHCCNTHCVEHLDPFLPQYHSFYTWWLRQESPCEEPEEVPIPFFDEPDWLKKARKGLI